MDINFFIAQFTSCLNTLPNNALQPDTEFKKLDDWSSIFALIVIAMVDSDFHKTLTADDIRSSTTLADLFNVIQSK